MKIAIPLFGSRISPHFLTAPDVLIVLVQGRKICSRGKVNVSEMPPQARRKKLLSLGVDLVICGGIDQPTRQWLEKKGIRVIPNVIGEAEDVLRERLGQMGLNGDKGQPKPTRGKRSHDGHPQ